MKWKNSFKKGSLAAFVTLALTGSALAMPTGGTVENGSVNVDAANFGANDAIANVANGATITPQTNSIINWEAFNIAQGEALHFNTTNAALLNRVTGAQMSELLGQMTQVGAKPLFLVNPNGIHIGGTASFDVSNLTLSTLNMDTAEFNRPKGQGEWALKQGAQGAKELRVDTGAQFNIRNDGSLALTAGKVMVADGVTFVADSAEHSGLYISAYKNSTVEGKKETGETEAGNTIDFRGKVSGVKHLEMNASNINIEGADLAGKDIAIRSVAKGQVEKTATNEITTLTAAPTNTLTVKNTKVVGDQIKMIGGKVDVADDVKFSFNADNYKAELTVAAVKSYFDENQGSSKFATEQGNDVSFHGTVESSGKWNYTAMEIDGATVNLDRAKFHTPDGELSANAFQSAEDKADGTWTMTATAANVVQADNLEIEGNRNDTEFWGGKVELKNTTIKTPGEVQVYAYKTFAKGSIDTKDMTAGADSVVQLTNTKILNEGSDPQAYSNVWVRGGKIEMNNSELASEDEIRLTASNSLHEVRAEGHIPKELKMEANAENTVRLSNTQLHANQASWQPSSEARYTPKNSIGIYGGKVDVADDVKFGFDAGSNETHLMVAAAKSYSENNNGTMEASTEQGNDVAFHGTVEADANRDAEVNIAGATVNLDRAKFRMPRGDLGVIAMQSTKGEHGEVAGKWNEKDTTTATSANVVQADGMEIDGNLRGTAIYGGRVDLKNTTVKTPGKIEIEAYTSREWTGQDNDRITTEDVQTGSDNVVRLEKTKLLNAAPAEANQALKWVYVRGGKVEIKDSELTSDQSVDVWALKSAKVKQTRDEPAAPFFPNYMTLEEYHTDASNSVKISNSKLHANLASWNTYENPECYVSAWGGKVALTGVDIKSPRDVDIYAVAEAKTETGDVVFGTGNIVDLKGTTIEAKGRVDALGGKVQMKQSSVQAGTLNIAATETLKGLFSTTENVPNEKLNPISKAENTLYLEDTTLKSAESTMGHAGEVRLMGGQVASKGVGINAAAVEIYSGQMESKDGKFYLTKGTPLHMDSTKIETPSYMSRSGAVNLVNGSEIKAKGAFFVAAESYDGNTDKATVTKDTNLSLWRSKVEADDLGLMTGGLNAWKTSEVKSQKPMKEHAAYLVRKDGSSFTMQRDEGSHIIEGGVEIAAPRVSVVTAPKEPSSPLFPLTPDNAQLSEQDQENITAGKYEAQDIIAAQTGTEAQSKALAEAVGKINNVPNASSRQKAGVVTGMIQAINEMNTLTTEEKHALQVAVLDAYGAVQEAKTEGSNRTQQANGDAMRLTTTESASANMPTAEEPQDAVHFAG